MTSPKATLARILQDTYDDYAPYIDMAMGSITNCVMITLMKILIDFNNIPTTVVVFVRMLGTIIMTTTCLALSSDRHVLRAIVSTPKHRPWLLLRGVFGIASFWLSSRSLKFIPVEDQQAIWYTCPILTGAIACIWPGDDWRRLEVMCGAVCLAGMLLVIQPGGTALNEAAESRTIGFLFAILGTVTGAVAFIIIGFMGREVNVMTSLFHFAWIGTVAMAVTMIAVPGHRLPGHSLNAVVCSMFLGVAVTGAVASFLMNRAVQMGRPGRVTLIMYIQVPFLLLSDYLVFAHHPNMWSLLGSGVIIAAAALLTINKDADRADDESRRLNEESEAIYQALPMTSMSETNSARQTVSKVESPSVAVEEGMVDSGSF